MGFQLLKVRHPELGRFMQTDPIGYYDSMNLYQYCGNNPVNWTDPLGLATTVNFWLTNGTKITLIDPTTQEFRDTVRSIPKGKIKKIRFSGHGESDLMSLERAWLSGKHLKVKNGKVVYERGRGESLADDLRDKLAEGAVIYFDGCNTAAEDGWILGKIFGDDNNIARTLSKELPNVKVKGNIGFGLGNQIQNWRIFGDETHTLGIPRTYVNGEEQ